VEGSVRSLDLPSLSGAQSAWGWSHHWTIGAWSLAGNCVWGWEYYPGRRRRKQLLRCPGTIDRRSG